MEINNQQELNLVDIIHFLEEFYRKILVIAVIGLLLGAIGCLLFGQYAVSATLQNYAGLDLPGMRYLQSALPKLEQENQTLNKNEEAEFLASEKFWEKALKANILITKADSKESLDPSALIAAGSKITTIDIAAKPPTKEAAIKRVEKIRSFFIDGSTLIALRDLVRGYELKVILLESTNKKKVATAKLELDYLEKRIKNLNALKNQYPNTATMTGQVLDAKDSGAKYLPITNQIVAATTDLNNLKESLARYKDEENQNGVYRLFVEKAKPLIEQGRNNSELANELLAVCHQIEKSIGSNIELIAIEEIKVALTEIQTNKIYGLKQIGDVDIAKPPYLKFIAAGLFGGLFAGMLLAISSKIVKKIRARTFYDGFSGTIKNYEG